MSISHSPFSLSPKVLFKVSNASDAAVPRVFSTSYGECENTVSMAYMNRCASEFQKGAARGITFTFATGDNGVGADSGSCVRFCGQWPAGHPWVTGVGGTEGGSTSGTGGEMAWSGSAGGFSDRWAIPSYQSDAVAKYKSTVSKLPEKTRYNNTGRGFPDVAAQATDFEVINGGFALPVAGTSCACPTFSGIVGLLNDLRLAAGKPVLGFMNPFIYQNADAFFDITKGNNPGCGTNGFEASAGWDAVSRVREWGTLFYWMCPLCPTNQLCIIGTDHWRGHAQLCEAGCCRAQAPLILVSYYGVATPTNYQRPRDPTANEVLEGRGPRRQPAGSRQQPTWQQRMFARFLVPVLY
jgi:subtilase family serine protease